jgi:NNP family nitrate/nitrite transporter-like MFS transporter
MTGLIGMSGGVGGFYLASSLGYSKQASGSYGPGFLVFALLAAAALVCISGVARRWRATWADAYGAARV